MKTLVLNTFGKEVSEQIKVLHPFQVKTVQCNVLYSHFAVGLKSLCFSHSRTGMS